MINLKKIKIPYLPQIFLVLIVLLVVFMMKSKFSTEQKIEHLKAVMEASKENGIKLSEIAVRTIGVNSIPVSKGSNITISASALVYSLDQVGVYRLRDQWYKFITVKIIKQADECIVTSKDLLPQTDQIVVSGSGLLRAAEMEALGGAE